MTLNKRAHYVDASRHVTAAATIKVTPCYFNMTMIIVCYTTRAECWIQSLDQQQETTLNNLWRSSVSYRV